MTDFVGMGDLYEQPRQHDQARNSHVLKAPSQCVLLHGRNTLNDCVAKDDSTVTQYICDGRHSDLPRSLLSSHCIVVVGGVVSPIT